MDEFLSNEISNMLIALGNAIPKADLIFIWQNYRVDDYEYSLFKKQIFEWNKKEQPTDCSKITYELENVMIPPDLEEAYLKDESVHYLVKDMTDEYSQSLLMENNVKAVLMIAIFVKGELWGCVSLDNCSTEEDFTDEEILIVREYATKLGDFIGCN